MDNNDFMQCPACNHSNSLMGKYEALYVYSYLLDDNAPGTKNQDRFYSFLYDKRELKEYKQYVECNHCGAKFPFDFVELNTNFK